MANRPQNGMQSVGRRQNAGESERNQFRSTQIDTAGGDAGMR
jgi:hypothetical protein